VELRADEVGEEVCKEVRSSSLQTERGTGHDSQEGKKCTGFVDSNHMSPDVV